MFYKSRSDYTRGRKLKTFAEREQQTFSGEQVISYENYDNTSDEIIIRVVRTAKENNTNPLVRLQELGSMIDNGFANSISFTVRNWSFFFLPRYRFRLR